MTPAIRLLFVGLAALGAGVLGYWLYDRAKAPEPVVMTLPVTSPDEAASGEAGPKPGEIQGPQIPTTRPDFTLKDLAGQPRSIAEWNGRSLVVNFWATWCAPCRREIPLLNRLHAEYAPRGVEIVGVAVDFAEDVAKYTKEFPISYPLLIGEEDGLAAASAFGVKSMAFPFSAFVDAKGRVLTVWMGEIHEPEARAILDVLGRMSAGELEPDAARAALKRALDALPPPAARDAEPPAKAAANATGATTSAAVRAARTTDADASSASRTTALPVTVLAATTR